MCIWASQVSLMVKNLPAKAGVLRHVDLIPRWGRSPVGRYDNPLQYPCLESPMNRACIYQSCSSNLPHYSLPLGNHKFIFYIKRSLLWTQVQFSSVAQLCPTLCDSMDRSTPGLPLHHQLLEFTQTHVHWVGDAIQPSHPLLLLLNLSQHQGLFKWVNS